MRNAILLNLIYILVPMAFIALAYVMITNDTKGFGWVILCAMLSTRFITTVVTEAKKEDNANTSI